jgi:hypothetical protein
MHATHTTPLRERMRQELQLAGGQVPRSRSAPPNHPAAVPSSVRHPILPHALATARAPTEPSSAALRPLPANHYPTRSRRLTRAS